MYGHSLVHRNDTNRYTCHKKTKRACSRPARYAVLHTKHIGNCASRIAYTPHTHTRALDVCATESIGYSSFSVCRVKHIRWRACENCTLNAGAQASRSSVRVQTSYCTEANSKRTLPKKKILSSSTTYRKYFVAASSELFFFEIVLVVNQL